MYHSQHISQMRINLPDFGEPRQRRHWLHYQSHQHHLPSLEIALPTIGKKGFKDTFEPKDRCNIQLTFGVSVSSAQFEWDGW